MALAAYFIATTHPENQNLVGLDFRAHYTAGKMLLAGAPIYQLTEQWAWQKSLWPQLSTINDLLYIPYPPFDILPMAAMAQFPLHTAYLVWLGGETVVLSLLCYALVNTLPALSLRLRMMVFLLCLTAVPVLLTLVHGQLSFVLAAAAFFAWHNCKTGHERRGGLWLSLLLVKPQFFIVPLLLFLLLRRGRVLQGMLYGCAILLTISLLLVGPRGLVDYVQLLASASQWGEGYGIHPQGMQSLRSLLHRLFNTNVSSHTALPWIIGCIAILGLTFQSWRHREETPGALFDLQWALMLFATTLCSPHLNVHDFTLLLVAGVLVFNATRTYHSDSSWLQWALLALPGIGYGILWADFLRHPVIPWAIPFQCFALLLLAYSCHFAASSRNVKC